MSDPAQILILVIIIILTIFLVVLGIQVFLILKDLRQTIAKTNKILDDSVEISDAVKGPILGVSSALMNIRAGANFANLIKKVSEFDREDEDGR